jgi:hypothetical protein
MGRGDSDQVDGQSSASIARVMMIEQSLVLLATPDKDLTLCLRSHATWVRPWQASIAARILGLV